MPFNKAIYSIAQDIKLLSFVIALFLYGLWGSPTPDAPGILEVVIGLLLLFSIGGVTGLFYIFSLFQNKQKPFLLSGALFLILGLIVPSIKSIFYNIDLVLILRDLVGFIFLCLPILFVPFFNGRSNRDIIFFLTLLTLSILFSIRVVYGEMNFFNVEKSELLYLANSPIVMFSLFFLPFWAVKKVYMQFTLRHQSHRLSP